MAIIELFSLYRIVLAVAVAEILSLAIIIIIASFQDYGNGATGCSIISADDILCTS